MKKDIVTGIVAVAIAGFVYGQAGQFAEGGASLARNPALYPRILAVIVFAIGAILLVQAAVAAARVRAAGGGKRREAKKKDAAGMRNVAFTALILIVYVGAIYLLGFIIPTAAFMLATPMTLGTKFKTALLVSVPATAVIYVVFFILFKVPIPSGILFQ
jgi:putative tricarboxylic transport membrane protein